jgi:hypothetical protein
LINRSDARRASAPKNGDMKEKRRLIRVKIVDDPKHEAGLLRAPVVEYVEISARISQHGRVVFRVAPGLEKELTDWIVMRGGSKTLCVRDITIRAADL